jgi:hypothetical protein
VAIVQTDRSRPPIKVVQLPRLPPMCRLTNLSLLTASTTHTTARCGTTDPTSPSRRQGFRTKATPTPKQTQLLARAQQQSQSQTRHDRPYPPPPFWRCFRPSHPSSTIPDLRTGAIGGSCDVATVRGRAMPSSWKWVHPAHRTEPDRSQFAFSLSRPFARGWVTLMARLRGKKQRCDTNLGEVY